MKDIQEAEEFYEEFLEIAPNDSTRYILNYKISKEKQVPLEQQIRILEEYKEKNLQKDGLTNWQNCIIRMVIQRNAWISVMRWFSGSVKANMS